MFYLNLFKTLFNLKLYLFIYSIKALFIYSIKALFIYSIKALFLHPSQSFPNRFYPFLSNSKNFKQTLSIACL